MIESAIKTALERITGMAAYPLLLPDTVQEGVTFQRISDPELYTGLLRTGLIAGRFQIAIHLLNDYTRLLQLDKKISAEWTAIVHGQLEGFPVQNVVRGGIQQSKSVLTSGNIQYRLVRDFTFHYREGES
ncbi:hypothetical protein H0141_004337 [Salmonella enterica]|nr:hypothetical protein [Salmonella enterica]EEM0243695.1 hypothetical protein [Salmonella enterica subsp. enterica serovar Brandenburg]ECG0730481.1 hypothetical protein [Salmonella enterica]EFR7642113.1 hypothetical protein [Salmonella enterica]EFR7917518.1 hypothetical protein [Salmonella enterica]